MTDPLQGRLLNALRSVAVSTGGLRIGAHPTSMPKLVEMGLVEDRALSRNRRGWFLTAEGRKVLRDRGTGESEP